MSGHTNVIPSIASDRLDVPLDDAFQGGTVAEIVRSDGAVMIRGFNWETADLERLTDRLGHARPANIHWVTSRRFESSDGTESVDFGNDAIPLHSESYYTPICPQILVFACVTIDATGGETTLCDGVELWQALPERLREVLANTEITWLYRSSFSRLSEQTQRPAAEFIAWCRANASCQIRVNCLRRSIRVKYTAPAIRRTHWGNEPAFANNLISLTKSGVLAGWVPDLDPAVVDEVAELAAPLTYAHQWRPGDILVIDNTRYMHGRAAWTGEERHIQVRMLTTDRLPARRVFKSLNA